MTGNSQENECGNGSPQEAADVSGNDANPSFDIGDSFEGFVWFLKYENQNLTSSI